MELVVVSKTRLFEHHLARVPFTTNQQATMEMRNEVLSSVGAQDMDTSGYQVSDLNDVDFHWENYQLNVDNVLRRATAPPFSPSSFNDF